ncbi:YkgJ family cysteine cluster protein [Candidatus Omnitrophota bacterium]
MFRIKAYVPGEYCLHCLGCCRYNCNPSIWAAGLLGKEKIKLNLKKIRLIAYRDYYICRFLHPESSRCKIYTQRPLECRLYPFLLHRLQGKVYLSVDLNCPYASGREKNRQFKDYVRYLLGYLKTPRVLTVLKDNRELFADYSAGNILNLAEIGI